MTFHSRLDSDYNKIFTARVIGRMQHHVQITDWQVYDKNFAGFHELNIYDKPKYVAYYKTEKDAAKAIIVRCMCEIANYSLMTNGLPKWTEARPRSLRDPTIKYLALYINNKNKIDEFFGLIDLDTNRKCLLIAMDDLSKVSVPWKPFYFNNID